MRYDHVVVGAGVYGCAVAQALAERGRSVVVLESGTIGCGASGGPGKRGVRGNRRTLRELPLVARAYELWPQLSDRLGADIGYDRTGGVCLIEEEDTGLVGGLVAAEAHAQVQSGAGVPTEVLGRERVLELLPEVSDGVRGGLYCPLDGAVDQNATTRAYADAARARGAVVVEGAAVTAFEQDGRLVRAVLTEDGARYEVTRSVLLANNAGARPLLLRELGVTLPIWPMHPQVVLMRPQGESPVPVLVGHDHRRLALKTIEDGLVMASAGWRGRRGAHEQGGVTVPELVDGNVREAHAVFPVLAQAEVVAADASRQEAYTQDEIPIVDLLPGSNAFVATGWTGHGFAIAPAVAELLAAWMEHGGRPTPLAPFRLDRFGAAVQPQAPGRAG